MLLEPKPFYLFRFYFDFDCVMIINYSTVNHTIDSEI